MTLDALNALPAEGAIAELLHCCGSKRWAERMANSRPFASEAAMADTADRIWAGLDPADLLEAFAAHPVIGSRASPASWSAQEQSGVQPAEAGVRERLSRRNRDYRDRFGYIFIVCATGKTAAEMLAILEARMPHDPARELTIAAEEQRQITRLRLRKLIRR